MTGNAKKGISSPQRPSIHQDSRLRGNDRGTSIGPEQAGSQLMSRVPHRVSPSAGVHESTPPIVELNKKKRTLSSLSEDIPSMTTKKPQTLKPQQVTNKTNAVGSIEGLVTSDSARRPAVTPSSSSVAQALTSANPKSQNTDNLRDRRMDLGIQTELSALRTLSEKHRNARNRRKRIGWLLDTPMNDSNENKEEEEYERRYKTLLATCQSIAKLEKPLINYGITKADFEIFMKEASVSDKFLDNAERMLSDALDQIESEVQVRSNAAKDLKKRSKMQANGESVKPKKGYTKIHYSPIGSSVLWFVGDTYKMQK